MSEEAFSPIETDMKSFEFEIPNDGLSRTSETRTSDLTQKQHKNWNLRFSDKKLKFQMRQSRCLFLLANIRFWYPKNCSANSFSWPFSATDFRMLFIKFLNRILAIVSAGSRRGSESGGRAEGGRVLAIVRFRYVENGSVNWFSWHFHATDFRIRCIQNVSKKKCQTKLL